MKHKLAINVQMHKTILKNFIKQSSKSKKKLFSFGFILLFLLLIAGHQFMKPTISYAGGPIVECTDSTIKVGQKVVVPLTVKTASKTRLLFTTLHIAGSAILGPTYKFKSSPGTNWPESCTRPYGCMRFTLLSKPSNASVEFTPTTVGNVQVVVQYQYMEYGSIEGNTTCNFTVEK